ncbi:MAG: hypothetical protein H6555_08330 [Lewinellaceae bacterium]|nr:hypothetical protein [Lewinellaceae bacterium]
MFHQNISRIIRWFKGRVCYESQKINPQFAWQSLFYDRIIRNEKEFNSITHYIQNNPGKWHHHRPT